MTKNSHSGNLGNPRGVNTVILNRSPKGSLVERRRESSLPSIVVTLDVNAHEILRKAAEHRHKPIQRLVADIVMGTLYLGDINTQTAKLVRYRTLTEKQQEQAAIKQGLDKRRDTNGEWRRNHQGRNRKAKSEDREIGAIAQSNPCAEV